VLRNLRHHVAILEEQQYPVYSSGTLNRLFSLGTLRGGALASRVH
jgi:hypothetical protein